MKTVLTLAPLVGAVLATPSAYSESSSIDHSHAYSSASAYSSSEYSGSSSSASTYSSAYSSEHPPPSPHEHSTMATSMSHAPVYPSVTPAPTYNGSSGHTDVDVTAIVTSFETYCPQPTTLTYNEKTYTVTSATTLTITNCPCEITTPVHKLPGSTTTEMVTSFETYCPNPTTITTKGKTYTATSATTLTITECPGGCVVTKTMQPETVTAVVTSFHKVYSTPTEMAIKGKTYTVTSTSEVVTVTDCPGGCTVEMPVTEYASIYSMAPSGVAASTGTAAPPYVSAAPSNGTTSSMAPVESNSGARVVGSGAGFAALVGGMMLL